MLVMTWQGEGRGGWVVLHLNRDKNAIGEEAGRRLVRKWQGGRWGGWVFLHLNGDKDSTRGHWCNSWWYFTIISYDFMQ